MITIKETITKGDQYHLETLRRILNEGTLDENPRPHYEDVIATDGNWYKDKSGIMIKDVSGSLHRFVPEDNQWIAERDGNVILCTPAHTLSINHVLQQYNLAAGECPIETLRPIAWKSAVKEILWIYQMQSNKLSDLHDLGISYWDDWNVGDGTIGCRYGETIRRHHLMDNLLNGLKKDPFGRRHIINMWQESDFHDETGGTTKGLNPCCYETIWNVRRGKDGELYLDMLMNQRSSDYETSCAINELQYIALQLMVAKACGFKPGMFSHMIENVQIYDRHVDAVNTLLSRKPIACNARLILDTDKTDFYSFTMDNFEMVDYPLDEVKTQNPQLKFQLGI